MNDTGVVMNDEFQNKIGSVVRNRNEFPVIIFLAIINDEVICRHAKSSRTSR